ncbi:Fic family protein [Myxococcus sp. Y35]|uniref:Fic family protein n=1 Tax=Pseudomyxococcus flavus TaxID=3115648 RepID=UPI003CEF40A5
MLATAAIEGNTLSESEVARRISGNLELPKSKEYLGKEIDNVVAAINTVWERCMRKESHALTVEEICEFNALVLNGLELEKDVVAGELRSHKVGVGNYLAPPAEDCAYLLQRMCDWLNGPDFDPSHNPILGPIELAIIKSVLAHLYLAWIHPFGDGNGRTARMLEFKILTDAGLPSPAVHLLSNHYNETRTQYYRELENASKSGGDVLPFIVYAVQGFVDQMRMQVDAIRMEQLEIAWTSHVYGEFEGKNTAGDARRKALVFALAEMGPATRAEILTTNHRVAANYVHSTPKTLTRDLNQLQKDKLIFRKDDTYFANKRAVLAFLPESTQQVDAYLLRLMDAYTALRTKPQNRRGKMPGHGDAMPPQPQVATPAPASASNG